MNLVKEQVKIQICDWVWDGICAPVKNNKQIWNKVWDSVRLQVDNQVCSRVEAQVDE